MAVFAGNGEAGCPVIGARCVIKVLAVAVEALHFAGGEGAGLVTRIASETHVSGVEWNVCFDCVIERCARPRVLAVARAAIYTELGAVEIVLSPDPVAVRTARGRALDDSVQVVLFAADGQVVALQRELAGLMESAAHDLPIFGGVTA